MIHPDCGHDARVIKSRPLNDQVRRRYECKRCHVRFTTHERVDDPTYNAHLKMAIKLLEASIKLEAA